MELFSIRIQRTFQLVSTYIDFMRKGIIPQYYEKDYKEWLSSQKED